MQSRLRRGSVILAIATVGGRYSSLLFSGLVVSAESAPGLDRALSSPAVTSGRVKASEITLVKERQSDTNFPGQPGGGGTIDPNVRKAGDKPLEY